MKNTNFFLTCLLIFQLQSCSNRPSSEDAVNQYSSDTILIQNNYPALEDSSVLEAIQSLNICSLSDTNTVLEPCDYTKFRVFKLAKNKPYSQGFILEMKEGLYNAPVKQTLIIENTFNKYKIINRYFGFLIELRSNELKNSDLLIGYKDPEMGIIAIRHQWIKEKYEPVSVEEINGYFIKPELQDSIDDLFISSFNAGY